MSGKESLWKSLKRSLSASSALFCRFCGSDTFTLTRTEKDDLIALECRGCYRRYTMRGEGLLVSDAFGGSDKAKSMRWDWSKTDWVPS